MTWLNDTEPYELKPHITRKRIMRGITPEKRKWKDAKSARRQFIIYMTNDSWNKNPFGIRTHGITAKGIPYIELGWSRGRKEMWREGDRVAYIVSGWNKDFIDGKAPHSNGKKYSEMIGYIRKSSRAWMRLIASWWQEANDV